MGGAVDVAGNVGDAESQEYNLYVDPTAADIVFRSGARITLVPLDATGDVPVTLGVIDRMRNGRTSLLETYAADLLNAQRDFIATGVFHFWDPLAAVVATDGRVAGFEPRSLVVVTGDTPESGRTIASSPGSTVTMAMSADSSCLRAHIHRDARGRLTFRRRWSGPTTSVASVVLDESVSSSAQ